MRNFLKGQPNLRTAHAVCGSGIGRAAIWLAWLVCLIGCNPVRAEVPSLVLANVYRPDIDLRDYWVSEKYDGIRAFWNGRVLMTRSGTTIAAPAWFLANWPTVALDGELWIGRGEFETVVATVRDAIPDDAAWRRVHYMVFDLPGDARPFTQRLTALQAVIQSSTSPWLRAVPQWRVANAAQLMQQLEDVVTHGAEGLMLHRGDSLYRAGRSDDLLKLKPYHDAEARVIAHLPGKGKYTHMLGALRVQTADGRQFSLGSGFTDEQRRHPPAIGALVTYAFHGRTASGLPRFARFLRVRSDGVADEERRIYRKKESKKEGRAREM